jgi:hypothetical protein
MIEVSFGSAYVVIREYGMPLDPPRDDRTLCLRSLYGADKVTILQFLEIGAQGCLSEVYVYRTEGADGPKLACVGEDLYVIGMDATAVFYNARLGRETARYEFGVAYYSALPFGDRVLLFGELEVTCASCTGDVLWEASFDDVVAIYGVDSDGRIRLQLQDGRLRWLDVRTGTALRAPAD